MRTFGSAETCRLTFRKKGKEILDSHPDSKLFNIEDSGTWRLWLWEGVAWVELKYTFIIVKNYSAYDRYVIAVRFTNKRGSFWSNPDDGSFEIGISKIPRLRDTLKDYWVCNILLRCDLQIKKEILVIVIMDFWGIYQSSLNEIKIYIHYRKKIIQCTNILLQSDLQISDSSYGRVLLFFLFLFRNNREWQKSRRYCQWCFVKTVELSQTRLRFLSYSFLQ